MSIPYLSDIPTAVVNGRVGGSGTRSDADVYYSEMVTRDTMGSRVQALRKKAGFTQQQAADEIGIARSTLASIEADQDAPGRETLFAIAGLFGSSVDFLRSGATAAPPEGGEFVKDPDELALVRFWRGLDQAERAFMLRLLIAGASDRDDKTAA